MNEPDKPEIAAKINRVLSEDFEVAPALLQRDKHLFTDIGLDSLDIVDLIFALQKAFSLHMREDERARSVRTLGDLHDLVETILREQQSSSQV